MNKKKPHLLIIGGSGFIGYHLALQAKKKNWKVTSLSMHLPKKFRHIKGINYLIADIKNFKNLKQKLCGNFTHVVNLGGYVNHSFSKNIEKKMKETHFIGLVNLAKIFLKKNIVKFVQIGSCAEYGKAHAPQSENLECFPNSPYALSKLASTKFLLMLYKSQQFPTTVLRFFQVYGPKQDSNRALPQIIKNCLSNKKFPVSQGNQIRDFCYIDDAVKAIFLALKSRSSDGEIINIGYGKPSKVKDVIRKINRIIKGGKPQFGKIKYRKDENMKVYPDIQKAFIQLKWKPKVNLNQGIKIVINSFRKNA